MSSPTSSSDARSARFALDEVEMESRSWELLRQLSAKIPSVRIAVASLSGGQRQTVAIARSLIGDPSIVILDEPTAALGVAQTAEVLNLIERLRERGLGVLLISHNLADVQAVADRAVVLRLGRNNGEFRIADVSYEDIIAAITGATDNVVTRREAAVAHARRPLRPRRRRSDPDPNSDRVPAAPTDLQDERLIRPVGVRENISAQIKRVRTGDLGALPVIVGLLIICVIFPMINPIFLSADDIGTIILL